MMIRSQLLENYYSDLADAIKEAYTSAVNSGGRIRHKIYIWNDGTIQTLDYVGDSWYAVQAEALENGEEMFFVCTIDAQGFDPFDAAGMMPPEDPAEREALAEELTEWAISEYDPYEVLDRIIEEAEREQKMED